ncbi:MAG: hypothetical protein ACLF0G_13555 [Candidatus Brocadiia bacterium]
MRARSTSDPRRGAMAAELAVLALFVYLPIVVGGAYIGWLSVARERVHHSNHYALYDEGDQSEALDVRGENEARFFREFTGRLRVDEGDAADADVPMPGVLRDMFTEFTVPIHYRHVSARGSFELVGSRVVYREHVSVDEGFRVRPEGQVVESLRLLADEIPENLTEYLQDYMRRRRAHSAYLHRWVHDDDPTVAGDSEVGPWNLWVPNVRTATRDEWHPEAAVRATKTRMVGDQSPPAAHQRDLIDAPLDMPGYEPSEDFWHPGGSTDDDRD